MAVAFDAKQATQLFATNSAGPFDHNVAGGVITVGSGTNRALIALITLAKTSPVSTVTSANWDSAGTNQSMSFIGAQNVTSGANQFRVELWGLVAPTSGQKTLHVVISGLTQDIYIDEVSFTGVDQTGGTTSFANFIGNSATTSSTETITITSAVGNQNVVNWVGDATMNAPSDNQIYLDTSGADTSAAGAYKTGAATSVTMTDSATNTQWAGAGVNVVAATSGGIAGKQFTDLPPRGFVYSEWQKWSNDNLTNLPTPRILTQTLRVQKDWPNPYTVTWYRSWEDRGNVLLPFPTPFRPIDYPNLQPISWYRSTEVSGNSLRTVTQNPFVQSN